MDVRLEQSENASSPMDVTPSGMLMDVSLEQPSNASSPMDVTPVKYWNSSNDVIDLLFENPKMDVTAAASA